MKDVTVDRIKRGIDRRIKKLHSLKLREQLFTKVKGYYNKLEKNRAFSDSYDFVNRSNGSENLLLILAGFQEFYWEGVLERVRQNKEQFNEDIDICICVPGENGRILKEYAEKYNWSYLRITDDLLAQAQNTAISLHPKAKWIYKIDEDIIISDNYFKKLKENYIAAQLQLHTKVGLVTPILNVNACGTSIFLNTIGMMEEYENKFDKLKIGMNEPIHKNPDVAEWIWEKTIPFSDVASLVEEKNSGKVKVCSYRLSIGAILFTREFWDEIGYFRVAEIGCMGAEEEQVNSYCMNNMYSIVIAEDTLAGHLGFFHQKESCRKFYEKHKKQILE